MLNRIGKALGLVKPKSVMFDGVPLPPVELRYGGKHFRDDGPFVKSAKADVQRLADYCQLTSDSRLLEVGCGAGRLPIGLKLTYPTINRYLGLDVNKPRIDWCREHLGEQGKYEFEHVDVENSRYNPGGELGQSDCQIPAASESIDCIYLFSVFSHLFEEDIRDYLQEFRRVLSKNGSVFLTAFVDDKADKAVEENPTHFGPLDWSGPLHCVLYKTSHLNEIFSDCGFIPTRFEYQTEADQQSLYILHIA